MKQSAVEWLIEQLNAMDLLKIVDGSNAITFTIEQAKEMEKQQIIDCGNTCALMQYIHVDKVNQMSIEEVEKLAEEKEHLTFGEEYYNETFNK
jgi:hypothetical protein